MGEPCSRQASLPGPKTSRVERPHLSQGSVHCGGRRKAQTKRLEGDMQPGKRTYKEEAPANAEAAWHCQYLYS